MIIDDIIRNKFHEILSSKDIEENMGFNNIYKIKRYEFFRESFVKEFKALLEDPNTEVYTLEGEAKSFLYFACHNNQKGIVRFLLAKGANIILDHNSGMTVFHTALTAQHFDMAAFLIENGVGPNYVVTGDNMTYLEICTSYT
ncbi:ankyrin repeat domain-containing protein [Rickettsia rickettsii]|uniref:Uncharacterized protein n=2 Tax=Rickettsia rickettsii TaxID=783 RepID=B0BWL6_RICRO|nr:ankyrin repeat domain-containing protein [Rickettsia rickettsii]ABV75895.1 hypothetical protein A1G_01625 [Rickettsia rickettsii str. 'Sheila Smith']ABY72242.1 hypothetical protein RrIowa_0344 [Rickettsia rickettsii str. Iowa]AFB22541.1 hypothetical protein RPN_05300 [Rickettsia rickettsii str. Brazil]AFB23223.1 hypothetical protein RPL_01600 [Rickettsia rickettsii str. Colombia]AFB24575.1 hypothetical protein RPO_01605 [Rickettsia rickettsii str. Arizona]